ncbi:MAG: SpoIIE family protein phosphatase [Acidobacteriota bacterium]
MSLLDFPPARRSLVVLVALAASLGWTPETSAQLFRSTISGLGVPDHYEFSAADPGPGSASGDAASGRRIDADLFPAEFEGYGWFWVDVEVDAALVGRPVGVRVIQEGAAEVYLNGRRVHSFGTVSQIPADEVADRTRDPRPLVFDASGSHRVAVRYSSWLLDGPRWVGERAGLGVLFAELRPMAEERLRLVKLLTFHQMFLSGLFLAFALVNLMLFLFRPVAGPNLFCGLAAASSGAAVFLNFASYVQPDPHAYLVYFTLFQVAFIALALASLRFVYSCTARRPPKVFVVFVAVAAVLALWALWQPHRSEPFGLLFMLLANVEIVRAVIRSPSGDEALVDDTWILGLGALPLLVLSPYQLLAALGLLPQLVDFLTFPSPYYGLAVLMFAMTVFIGRNYGKTQRQLERELETVRKLSAEKLEQERLAREKEVERARLEAENARRAEELEEARRLQTSMLPSTVPPTDFYAIEVHAETATEVGGDYYDFLSTPDHLTVIVGDASGHGAQAGSLVAATKGMLLAARDSSPAACLDRLSRGLRRMGLRRRHMALAAARFDLEESAMTLAAAAMPPVLVYRAADRSVSTVIIPSLPLGSFKEESYEQTTVPLHPGDRVVMMSDGLPERVDAELQPLSYERVEALVAEHGHLEPRDLIESLLDAGRRHAGSGPPDDDVTLVVIAVRPPDGELE